MSAKSTEREFVDDDTDIEEEEEQEEKAEPVQPASSEDPDTDNVGDASVEINVEELISELEHDGLLSSISKECQTKKRLEELMEQRRSRRDLEDFDDYDL